MPKLIDIATQKFNRLTAIEYVGNRQWRFRCDCENETVAFAAAVKNGNTKSCGCLNTEAIVARNTTHGQTGHPLYQRWAGMIQRCTNPGHVGYANYGGRGIKVCTRWRESFAAFLEDMGAAPEGMTIERDKTDGDYEPGNCKWATTAEQSRNTRRNVLVEIRGVTKTIRDWEIERGVRRGAFQRRIDLGWPPARAVSESIQPGKPLEKRV